jgi:hypothetical protein
VSFSSLAFVRDAVVTRKIISIEPATLSIRK